MRRFFKSIRDYWVRNFITHIIICQSNEHVFIGKKLWKYINEDLTEEQKKDVRVFFKKYPVIKKGVSRYEYMMLINPDFGDLKDPNGETPFTAQIQLNVFGHLGFQSVQPTPAEIVYEYGINCDFEDKVTLGVERISYNGTHAYVIKNKVIGKPIKPTYRDKRTNPHNL